MRKALGKGLEALLPPSAAPAATGLLHVPVERIAPNPDQPRRVFADEALRELAQSIEMHGVLQPVVVRRAPDGYELIAGERRLRAARLAGLREIPAVVRDSDPRERVELALIENLQRQDLTPLEEAEAYRQLMQEHGLTQEEVAARVGKSRPAIANALRLLGLPPAVKARLEAGELTAGHARAILSLPDAESQIGFAREIAEARLPKSEAERVAAARRAKPPVRRARGAARTAAADPHWRALADELTRALGTRVRLAPRGVGGTIEIEFYSPPELERLVHQLTAAAR